jgi:hypothetical protein
VVFVSILFTYIAFSIKEVLMSIANLITEVTNAVTGIVDGATIAVFLGTGVVISLGAMLVRRFIRAGR